MQNSILLHVCCAHCTAYTVEYLRKEGYEVTAFWYNPNIHPFTEHQYRLEAIKSLSIEMQFPLVSDDNYDMIKYFQVIVGHETDRCRHCFNLRLSRTVLRAKRDGFTEFTTTLLISPHQKHELIKEVGEAAAQGLDFLYVDLRKRYSDSRHITKPLNLYRQQYCGCIYSEWERYSVRES
jgi:epoxyqueuosine reductase